jgi:hypothetical protein
MELVTVAVSVLGGGLAGACVNVVSGRMARKRDLRTKFYPKLNNMWAAYLVRMQNPQGRYWTLTVGKIPLEEDREFIEHRSAFFMSDLVQFNELKEVRILRAAFLNSMKSGDHTPGIVRQFDLKPEADALDACLRVLHDKLNLES